TFGSAGYAYLVDNRGNLIAHKDPSRVLKRQPLAGVAPVARFLRKPFSPDTEPAAEVLGLIGSPVLSTYAPVPGVGWAVIVEEPLDEAFADLRRMRRFALLLLVVGLVVGAVMIAVASDEITKPIRELHRGVELIGKGNLDHRVEIKSGDEIERLAEGFNKMAAELKSSYSTLEQKVAQRTHELSVLYDVTATVNQSLDLDVILREVIQKVLETMRFDAVRIYLLEPEGKELRMRAHHGIGPEFLSRSATDPVGVGIIGTVAVTGKPLIFEDIGTDLQYGKLARGRLAQEMGFHAHVSFPLKTTTKTLGVMNFLSYQVRALLPNQVALLTAMAHQIGIALENANLFADSREKTAELEKVNANLAEANRAKAEFMAAMSHELRTPLNVIIGSADLAKDGFFGQVTSQQNDAMEKILRYSKMLLKMVNDVLTLTRIEAKKMTLEVSTFHLEEILFHIRTYMEQL
ncbi:MAG: GAF domain-containing protein, partial [Candidatus Binatia bacterium]